VQHDPAAGIWLRLNPRTGSAVSESTIEPEVQRALQEQVAPCMTFYDVGVNIDFFSLLGVDWSGRKAVSWPSKLIQEITARLRENVSRNSFSSVTIEEKAVWSETLIWILERSDPAVSPERGLDTSSLLAATIQSRSPARRSTLPE
jgi:hypothetical protein